MQPVKIAIASVLKPLKDSRSYYKFALSLRETNKYQINIIGFYVKKETDENLIKFHPLFYQNRKSILRFSANFRLLKLIQEIKPKLLIVTTYELLPAAVIGKLLYGYNIIYDIQENYALNLIHNNSGNKLVRFLFSKVIQCVEYCSRPFIDHFIFAEACYKQEFPAIKNHTLLENKFQGPNLPIVTPNKLTNKHLRFLLCGTLTEVYGSIEAIEWFIQFQKIYPDAQLRILGHAPLARFRERLKTSIAGKQSIIADISPNPIPYESILDAFKSADAVLLPYHQIPSISPKIPSKLYECLALGKPFLFTTNPKWQELAKKYNAGLEIDFKDFSEIPQIHESLTSQNFYNTTEMSLPHWKADEEKFLALIKSLTSI